MQKGVFSLLNVLNYLLPLAVSLVALHYMIGLIPTMSTGVLAGVYIILIIYYLFGKGIKFEGSWMIFLLYLPLTIILGRPSPIFHSWERFFLFAVMYLVCSPVIQTQRARKLRHQCFVVILWFSAIFSIGSFFAYFVGINLFSTEGQYDDFTNNAGWFSGLTRQSMMLAPISGITVIYFSHKLLVKKNFIYLILMIPCAGSLLFSASRSALGATILGCFIVSYLVAHRNKKIIRRIVVLFVLAIVSFPLWQSATSAVQQKQQGHADDTELFDSRSGKIEARWDEFSSSPFWGIGFCAIDANGHDSYNRETGTIEPGSSWLGILSMTGFVGFFLFIRLSIITFKVVKQRNVTNDYWLLGILSFFFVHMLVEGYVYAAGNPITFILWQSLGNCYDKKYQVI